MSGGVLIVEDELLVALDLEGIVEESGYVIAASCDSVEEALTVIGRQALDCAILDVQLLDGEVFPAADRLQSGGVPIIFHSGHADEAHLRSRYPEAQICPKPSSPSQLRAALQTAMPA